MDEFTWDLEFDLDVPHGVPVRGIVVKIRMEPPTAGAMIYGKLATGARGSVEIKASTESRELPFVDPHIWVKRLRGLTAIEVIALGWREI